MGFRPEKIVGKRLENNEREMHRRRDSALEYCRKEFYFGELIFMPDILKIENGDIVSCDKNAVDVVFPEDILRVRTHAFEGCASLKSVKIPKKSFSAYESSSTP